MKLSQNTIINTKKKHDLIATFSGRGGGGLASAKSPPPWYKTLPQYNVYYVDMSGISGVLYHEGAMSHEIIPFLVDYVVNICHIDLSKIIQHSEIF